MEYNDDLERYEIAKDMLAQGQSDASLDILCDLYNALHKQAHLEDDSWRLLTRITVDLKKIAFGLPGFDGWDVY